MGSAGVVSVVSLGKLGSVGVLSAEKGSVGAAVLLGLVSRKQAAAIHTMAAIDISQNVGCL